MMAKRLRVGDVAYLDVASIDKRKLDRTRRSVGTLTVESTRPLLPLVPLLEEAKINIVIAVDSSDEVVGLLYLPWVTKQLKANKKLKTVDPKKVIARVEADPEEARRGFHHEYLNQARPSLYWCQTGQHIIGSPSCSVHRQAHCSPM